MLTTPSTLKGDSRVMCGLIAATSLRLIEKRTQSKARERETTSADVFEASLLRLLEIYEYDAFDLGKSRAILARAATRKPVLRSPDFGASVRDAIKAAHDAMYPGMRRAKFCALLAEDVRACFGSTDLPARELARHKAQLRRFLILVRERLAQ